MDVDFSNVLPLFFIAVVVIIVAGRFRKRNSKQPTSNQANPGNDDNKTSAGYVHRPPEADEQTGDTDYEGTTGGIRWTLRSTVLPISSTATKGGSQAWRRKSMWRAAEPVLPAGKFILLMSTPEGLKVGQIKRGGLINTVFNKAADVVLDLFVSGYFGNEYKSLVNIGEDGVKVERAELADFYTLTNLEPLAQKFLDPATVQTISGWKHSNLGFAQEQQVDQFGLLFSPDGVILTCQASMQNAEEVKLFSDFGSVLAYKMKEIISG